MKTYILEDETGFYRLGRIGLCICHVSRIFNVHSFKIRVSVSKTPFKGSRRVKRSFVWAGPFGSDSSTKRQLNGRGIDNTILTDVSFKLDEDFPDTDTLYINVEEHS